MWADRAAHPAVIRPGEGRFCAACNTAWPCESVRVAWQERMGGPGHRCQCRSCHPEYFPRVPDDGAPYVSIAHDSGWRGGRGLAGHPAWRFCVELNGQRVHEAPVDWLVTEALAGEMGWLVRTVRHAGYPHYQCLCGAGPCQRAEYGRVVLLGPDGLRIDGTREAA